MQDFFGLNTIMINILEFYKNDIYLSLKIN